MINYEGRFADYISRNSLLRFINLSTSSNLFPSNQLAATFLNPIRNLLEYLARRAVRIFSGQANLADLKGMKGSKQGKFVLVVASGPSVSFLDERRIIELRKKGVLDIISVNSVTNSEKLIRTGVDYVVLSDPCHDRDPFYLSADLGLSLLPEKPKGIFLPRHFAHVRKGQDLIAFEDIELPKFGLSTNPTMSRRYLSLTALKALAISGYLGYEKIFIVGLDASMFQTIEIDGTNSIIQHPNHVAGAGDPSVDVSSYFPKGMMDYLYDAARFHFHARKYFSALPIFNLVPSSFTDAFPKEDPLLLFRADLGRARE